MKKKQTRRELFLAEMDAVVPWLRLLALIVPHYPKIGPKGGRPPMPLELMLRVYFLQNWYALSDPMAEEMLYDSEARLDIQHRLTPPKSPQTNGIPLVHLQRTAEKRMELLNGRIEDVL